MSIFEDAALFQTIQTRGYWLVVIRPSRFLERRISEHRHLEEVIRNCVVQLRGWDFPHIDPSRQPARGVDWVGQESSWNEFLEVWRFYFSGQFVDAVAVTDDWRADDTFIPGRSTYKPGESVSVHDIIFRTTEIFEFSSRLGLSEVADEDMTVSIRLCGMKNRKLEMSDPGRGPFRFERVSSVDEIPLLRNLSKTQLISTPRELARDAAREVFAVFGWDASTTILEEIQDRLWR